MAPKTDQTFSFEIVSCLLASLLKSNVTIGSAHFALMEKIDGSTTKSGYEHRFRAVKARAKEINDSTSNDDPAAATPAKATPAKAKRGTPTGSKRKARSENTSAHSAVADQDQDDEEEIKKPSKKIKKEKNDDDLLE